MGNGNSPFILAGVLAGAVIVASLVLLLGLSAGSPTEAAVAPDVGMKPGERYHLVHVDSLQLRCDACHSNTPGDYVDPMAQISNSVDKAACLACHGPGSAQPFYGDEWQSATVSR